MWFLIDEERKIIFGWSAKCGSCHVISIFWFFQNGQTDNEVHTIRDMNGLPEEIENYEIIIFSRSPYARLVSGFLEKYKENGQCRHMWKNEKLTFENFVAKLNVSNWNEIDEHHFTPQTSECFNEEKVRNAKKVTIFDINKINYSYLENIYDKIIPSDLKNNKGGHATTNKGDIKIENLARMEINDIYKQKQIPYYFKFYEKNSEIVNIVKKFYENDFLFFQKYNINY
jgi:hypothetical protein